MTITRIVQYPYEIQYLEVGRGYQFEQGDFFTGVDPSNANPYTGTYSLKKVGVIYGGHGAAFASANSVRASWMMGARGTIGQASYLIIEKSGQSADALTLQWSHSTLSWRLLINGVQVQETSFFETPVPEFSHDGMYCSHGFFLDGGDRFIYTIDGIPVIDYNSAGVPTGVGAIWIGSGNWFDSLYIDDFYIETLSGESAAVPPTYRFMHSPVNADGSVQDWASFPVGPDDYTAVDEVEVDDDTTYNWTPSSGSPQDYNTLNVTLPDDNNIVAAIPYAVCRKGDSSIASQIRLRCYNSGYANGADQDLPAWYTELWERFETDPSSNPWTESSFNATEFGVQSRGTV